MKRISRAGAFALCAGSLTLAGVVTAGAAQASTGVHAASRLPQRAAPSTVHVETEASPGVKNLTLAPKTESAEVAHTESPEVADTPTEIKPETVQLGDHADKNLSEPPVQVTGVSASHTSTVALCNLTMETITYEVGADGTISSASVVASPATGTVHQESSKGVTVSFSDHERVQIRVSHEEGSLQVRVHEKIRCEASDPSVNAPESTTSDDAADDATVDNGDATDAPDTPDAPDVNGSDHQGATHGSDHAGKHGSDDSSDGGSDHSG